MEKEKILIVEDHKDSLDACVSLLTAVGYDVAGVESGKEALSQCRNEEFQLVISDYQLEDTTGLEVLAKAQELLPQCATIIITAYATNELICKAFAEGLVTAFLMKPLNTDKLLLTVKSCLLRQSLRYKISKMSDNKVRRAVVDPENLE